MVFYGHSDVLYDQRKIPSTFLPYKTLAINLKCNTNTRGPCLQKDCETHYRVEGLPIFTIFGDYIFDLNETEIKE